MTRSYDYDSICAENAQLRAQVAELQAELEDRRAHTRVVIAAELVLFLLGVALGMWAAT